MQASEKQIADIFVIGGGINGVGIARDAVGRGMTVKLAEMNDLASATSSASTKLFHGGLRYLEFFKVRLVREALIEREELLRAMPHISWPMRFVLPYHKDMRFDSDTPTSRLLTLFMPWMKGRRPAWLIRMGLFMYDHLGGRKILPGTKTLSLPCTEEGRPIDDRFEMAYEYSDCWVQDARLVVLNARDAEARGAQIMVQTKVTSARREDGIWVIETVDQRSGETHEHRAKVLVNAGGPWVGQVLQETLRLNSREGVRLVRGSHIVTRKLYDHDKCYFFQGTDGRIIFSIPYEQDFTLIGTTDAEHENLDERPTCTEEERDYLIEFANNYFKKDLSAEDVVWTYSGVRPLYDDGASSATAATRDYVLKVDDTGGAPVLHVFGGKITTYRRLAENAIAKLVPYFDGMESDWTAGVPLPGGDFHVEEVEARIGKLVQGYPFLSFKDAQRLFRAYGTEVQGILGQARKAEDLGRDFGAGLSEAEVVWLMDREYATRAEDIVWRRGKLGLHLDQSQIDALDGWMQARRSGKAA